MDLARTMGRVCADDADYPMKIVGVRPGEKIHETLVSEEEMVRAEESRWYYDIHPVGTFIPADRRSSGFSEYPSDNTGRMSKARLAYLLETKGWAPSQPALPAREGEPT